MLTVDDYGRIRRAHRDGMGIREIARRFHHSRQKVRKRSICPSDDRACDRVKRLKGADCAGYHKISRSPSPVRWAYSRCSHNSQTASESRPALSWLYE